MLHVQTEADSKIASALVLRLKLTSGLDISEKRLPQDGRFNIKVRNSQIDVRMSTMPTQYGESVVMRLLNQSSGLLGLERPDAEAFWRSARRGAGQAEWSRDRPHRQRQDHHPIRRAEEINTPERKIITAEDPSSIGGPGSIRFRCRRKSAQLRADPAFAQGQTGRHSGGRDETRDRRSFARP